MTTADWVVLWVGVAMIAAGTSGFFLSLLRTEPSGDSTARSRSLNPVEYVKALKDVPAVNLLIGLGALLVLLGAGIVDISLSTAG